MVAADVDTLWKGIWAVAALTIVHVQIAECSLRKT